VPFDTERKETEKSFIVKGTRILHRALRLSLNRGDALTHIKSTLANAVTLWVIATALPFDNCCGFSKQSIKFVAIFDRHGRKVLS
jgi:hypothetical protein